MAQRPGFDMRGLSMGTKGALLVGALFFIDLFLPWQRACFGGGAVLGVDIPETCTSRLGWAGLGVILGLLVIALLVWEGMSIAGVQVNAPKKVITAALGAGIVLFTLLKILVDNEALSYGAWIGIVLALAMAYVAWVNYQEGKLAAPPMTPPPAA